MGWKNVKEHYKIVHNVCVQVDKDLFGKDREVIAIGSGFISDLITIDLNSGVLLKRYSDRSNAELNRYMAEMDADIGKLKDLILTPDTFGELKAVYTYSDAQIIEKKCEEYGWPNVTADGEMMYDNTFSKDRTEVAEWARRAANSRKEYAECHISRLRSEIAQKEIELQQAEKDIKLLESA